MSVIIHNRLPLTALLAQLYTESGALSHCCAKPCFGVCLLAALGSELPACTPGPPFTACTPDQARSFRLQYPIHARILQAVPLEVLRPASTPYSAPSGQIQTKQALLTEHTLLRLTTLGFATLPSKTRDHLSMPPSLPNKPQGSTQNQCSSHTCACAASRSNRCCA